MADAPSILVVLPTLGDRIATLIETLESIELQRRDVDLRLIVVLPDGADEARALALRYGAEVVADPRRGISEAINCGLEQRRGEQYYAWMGDDDLFRPGGLGVLQALIESKPNAVASYGGCEYIDLDGNTLFTSAAGAAARWMLPWGPDLIPHPGSLIRLDDLEAIGRYDPSLRYVLDLDMFLKLRRRGPFVATRRVVSAFRWHTESLTVSNRSGSSREAEMVKRHHLPSAVRPFSPLWHVPVSWAASLAARRVSAQGRRFARDE